MTSLTTIFARHFDGCFKVLILDNEATVDAFVTDPPLPWLRLTAQGGIYTVGNAYPSQLTTAESEREKLNWDKVSNAVICDTLRDIDDGIDVVAFGNNAGQGVPLAEALPAQLRPTCGAIIFGRSLPEHPTYVGMGYKNFCPRDDLLMHLVEAAKATGRPLALGFINTIEHNDQNYHT
ncbi:MAG: hypothetical protein ACI82H_000224 [Alphaproteobacteria bacterium]|jgi:hypothetical protein